MTGVMSRTTQAYRILLDELRAGTRKPGSAISVKHIAEGLKVSPTPVREALERLVGEGMVSLSDDRNGFVVPRLGVRGFISLVETSGLLVENAAMSSKVESPSDVTPSGLPSDPVLALEAVFEIAFRRCSNGVTIWLGHRLSNILASYRSLEPLVLPGWQGDLDRLERAFRDGRQVRPAIRAHISLRRQYAAEIVDRVESIR